MKISIPVNYCDECGREMVFKPKKVGRRSFDNVTGDKKYHIKGDNYPSEEVQGMYTCPSLWCRLLYVVTTTTL